jgi:protein-tyrosine-phosphatase
MSGSFSLGGADPRVSAEKTRASERCERLVQVLRAMARRVVVRLETRRAEMYRRSPGAVAGRLQSARTVLVLCQGNVSRSVFAAHVLTAALRGRQNVTVVSAGLGTQPGWRAHPRVIARCHALGLDIRGHASVAVTAAMVRAADVVFVMEVSHLVEITRRFFGARRKTFLLTCLAPDVPRDIEDPAGKADAEVDACMDHVARALTPLIDMLAGGIAREDDPRVV